jgi:hypothetical protein
VRDYAVDIQILMHASGLSSESRHKLPCLHLLEVMRDCESAMLVLDTDNCITTQYAGKLGESYGTRWVREMAGRDKVRYVPRARIPKGVRVQLAEKGFGSAKEDYQLYVRTAASAAACIVSRDPHFRAVSGILKKQLGVTVRLPDEVREACESESA